MADAPVTVRANADGGVTIAATCQDCGARHVVVIGNVGAFTRQTVVSILGNARPAGAGAGLAVTSRCGRCMTNAELEARHARDDRRDADRHAPRPV